jgi:hypothetical protein
LTGTAGFANITASGTLGVTGVTTVQAGTAALPAITTSGDTNTGIFFPAADTIAFTESGVECARFNSSGNFQTIATIGVGNATPSTSGAGITFPATQSASSNANTLDDYEEGTFTPTAGGGTTTTGTPVFTGTYTKVGKIVTVSGYVGGTTVSYNPVGGTFIDGLPFTTISNTIGVAMIQNGNNSGSSVASINSTSVQGFVAVANGAGTIFYSATYMTS